MINIGTIVKIIGDIYTILTDNGLVQASVRATAKKSRIVVGDRVQIIKNDYSDGKYIITGVLERRNFIPRPTIANLDKLIMVISSIPQPDLFLIDKLYIYCLLNNIEPVLVINKCDLASSEFIEDIQKQYYFLKIFVVSAKDSVNISNLSNYISGCLCALCGQSAVGKSSILNKLMPHLNLETQGLSQKIERGKHTTRVNEIFISNDLMIADTPGFTSLELDIDYRNLQDYYPEFQLDRNCKYLDCSHIKEGKDCSIVLALENSEINKDRYVRYVELYNKLKEKWETKYD